MRILGIQIAGFAKSRPCWLPHVDAPTTALRAGVAGAVFALGSCIASAHDRTFVAIPASTPADSRTADSSTEFDRVGERAPRFVITAAPASPLPGLSADRNEVTELRYRRSTAIGPAALEAGLGGVAYVAHSDRGDAWPRAQSPSSTFGVGFRLGNDSRMSLRLRRGGFGVLMRTAF
jgi:hypothetical protein